MLKNEMVLVFVDMMHFSFEWTIQDSGFDLFPTVFTHGMVHTIYVSSHDVIYSVMDTDQISSLFEVSMAHI